MGHGWRLRYWLSRAQRRCWSRFVARMAVAAAGEPLDALDPADPRRIAFGRMHGLSVLLMGIGLLAACVALVVIARHVNARSAA